MELTPLSIGDALKETARTFSNREAVVYVDQSLRLTWSQVLERTEEVARSFLAQGLEPGDHIAIWGTNTLEWLLTQYAAALIGCPLITINPEWKTQELEYALKQSDTKCLVMIRGFEKQSGSQTFHYDYIKLFKAIPRDRLPELRKIILVSESEEEGMMLWKTFLKASSAITQKKLDETAAQVDHQATALIQYTSGTTGFPKGAMLSHYGVLNNARAAAEKMELTEEDRLCGPVPYYHCFGSILVNLTCLATGTTMVIPAQTFNPLKTLQAIDQEKCTALYGVPTMFLAQLEHPEFKSFHVKTLRTGIMAGAPCPIELMNAVVHQMGASKITIGYGLTEASPLTHQSSPDDSIQRRVSTVGRSGFGCQAKVVHPKTFETCPTGVVGEIWVKGYNLMKGYYKKPEETEKAFVDGWLRTGDLGTVDHEGYYRISGRLKEMIIVGGHNVYPAEIEQTLLSLFPSEIEAVQIVGIPHPTLQEVAAAFIKTKANQKITEAAFKAKCEQEMEWPKVPKVIRWVNDFSNAMTVTGKIQKFKLREMLLAENQSTKKSAADSLGI